MQSTLPATGQATSSKSTFSRVCSVTTNIRAKPEIIWGLLTNAANMPKWNSTIISVEGRIALGEKIAPRGDLASAAIVTATWTDGSVLTVVRPSGYGDRFARPRRRLLNWRGKARSVMAAGA